ncbi:efflux RND transporter periplasmic adaptor subunit [Singulisphaera sp. PoT]|uniref:efflux RND transporter periplasmic adaptor subunit n=1 Tax=Singulisphaera sp. PoT TaxID=3411797 RepID=UPI003BF47717
MIAIQLAGCGKENEYVAPPAPEVTVVNPVQKAVTNYLEYTGTTQAVERVDLRARVKGFLKEKLFQDGSDVKAGQLLMVIDEEPFQVQLEQAKAREAEAEASLKRSEESKAKRVAEAQLDLDTAQLVLSRLDEGRNRTLLSRNAGSREDLEKSEATRKKNEAQVEADRANLEQAVADYEINILAARSSLRAAKAAVRNAEIDLGYCRIASPIDGRINRREFDVGNFVGDGQATVLATIVKTNPIYTYINISEDDLLKIQAKIAQGKLNPKKSEGSIPMEMGLGNDLGYPNTGHLDYADPSVDTSTGTVRLRGVFDNPKNVITPGLFVRVRVPYDVSDNALLVPDRALGADQAGSFLLVVGKKNVIERRNVTPGTEVEGMRVVTGKVTKEDLVVVDGLQRARPGLEVKPAKEGANAAAVASSAKVPEGQP